jgi:hypothetical protein
LHPLTSPWRTMHLLQITNHVQISNPHERLNFLQLIWRAALYQIGV